MNNLLKILIILTISFTMFSPDLSARKKRRYKKKSKTKKSVKKTKAKKHSPVSVQDKKVEIIHERPKAAIVKEPINIEIKILNDEKTSFVILHYASQVLEDWTQKEMVKENNKYFAVIPSDFVLKKGVSYYIEVVGNSGDVVANYGTEKLPMLIDTYVIKRAGEKIIVIADKRVKRDEVLSLKDELAAFDLDLEVETVSKKVQKTKLAPGIVSVITRSMMLKTGAKSLIDVLRYLPGVDVKILPSGKYSVSIRGVGKDGNILLMINGNRINNPYNSEAIYDMPTNFIEKIEVIRGPGSSLFGTDAVVGIINIFTTKKDKSVKASGGLYHNYDVSGNYSINRRGVNIDLSGGVGLDNGANQIITTDASKSNEWSLTYNGKEFETNRWGRRGYLSMKFSTKKFELFIFAMENKRGTWVGPNFIATDGSTYKNDTIIYSLNYSIIKNKKVELKTRVYGNLLFTENYMVTAPENYLSPIPPGDNFDKGKITKEIYDIFTLTTEISLDWSITKNLNLLTGLSYQYLKMLNYDLTRNYNLETEEYHGSKFDLYDGSLLQSDKSRNVIAYYLQSTYDYKDFGATLGLRFDYYNDFGLTINPRAGLVYNLFDTLVIKALYGQAFRAPTIKELYDRTDQSNNGTLGNEDLNPENVKTSEIGLLFDLWKFNINTNIFYNINENIIAPFDEDGKGSVGKYENIGSTNDLGIEAEIRFLLNKHFNVFLNASWFQRKFEWNDEVWRLATPKLDDRTSLLTDIPMRTINIGFNFNYQNFGIFLGIRNRSRALNNNRMELEEINVINIPEYWKLDFNISYNITDNFLLYFAGTDIGTTSYASPSNLGNTVSVFGNQGLVQPSYTLRLGLIYRFNFEKE